MKVLMVCLGNICRSPLAEGILRHKAQKKNLDIKVDSAGTASYHVGEAPDPRSQETALENNINISGLRGRQFQTRDYDDFDKILVMDSSNYQNVISLARNQADKDKVELILNYLNPNTNQSVPDPYYGGNDGFRKVFEMLDRSIARFIEKEIVIKL